MKKFYIPTSIVYTNSNPHIGFALELIQADVIARYHRQLGEDVLFSTGTDEHGIKNAQAAKAVGKTSADFTGAIAERVRDLTRALSITNDDFISTTDKKRHWPTVRKVWLTLKDNRDIYKKRYRGLYCVGCESFTTERDLINGQCPIHKRAPELIEEENYFFRLSEYEHQLKRVIEEKRVKIIPEYKRNELVEFVSQGLEDVSCSRPREKLDWGIPVPDDESQTVYVWLEALVNYLSVVDYVAESDKFKKFWPPDIHVIGKDIFTRFHGSLWPALLLSLGLELPKAIFVHGFITVDGQKMSKSLGNVVDPFALIEKYGADALRYFLLREIPATEDGDFTEEKFIERYNADLAGGLGNLVARILALSQKPKAKSQKYSQKVKNICTKARTKAEKALQSFQFNQALETIWEVIHFCDRYIEKQRPWENDVQSQSAIFDLRFAISNIAELLKPFLPETSEKITNQLEQGKGTILFPRIET